METCKGKLIHDTKEEAVAAMNKLIESKIEAPDDPLREGLTVYAHQGHWHVGHWHKTTLQKLLITVRRYQK